MDGRVVSLILATGLAAMAEGARAQEAAEAAPEPEDVSEAATEQEDGGGLPPVYRLEGVVVLN